jgi:hypothetical protein
MSDRLGVIEAITKEIADVSVLTKFEQNGLNISGSISVFIKGLSTALVFDVIIYPSYPFKTHDSESIKFFTENLLEHNHVMGDGSICIHTAHTPDLANKLIYDVESVKAWIKKYYIDKDTDKHYEHIIVPEKVFKNSIHSYLFQETNYSFTTNEFGSIEYSQMSLGMFKTNNIATSIIQRFKGENNVEVANLNWNVKLKSLATSTGLFVFIENIPAVYDRFAFDKWEDLKPLLDQRFLDYFYKTEQQFLAQNGIGKLIPLMLGYRISEDEIHWQAIMLEIGDFPIQGTKTGKKWVTVIKENIKIEWAITRNVSSKYFFGRGKFENNLTESKILIVGIGAIGSMIAKTFTKCGCTNIDVVDYDIKEPENVCRSEYPFITGMNNKTTDLMNELYSTSPYLVIAPNTYEFSEAFNYFMKSSCSDSAKKKEIEEHLNKYDLVIDCSTDNDLLYILSQLKLTTKLLNISISNHAKHLVCAAEANRYQFVMNQFRNVLEVDTEDLYNPTGCWSPTFKASYNDINLLVQYAIKHINTRYSNDAPPLKNFIIQTSSAHHINLELKEF